MSCRKWRRFQVAHAGEILDEQQAAAAISIWDGNELQEMAGIWHFNRLGLHLSAFLAKTPGFNELVLAENLGDVAIDLITRLK